MPEISIMPATVSRSPEETEQLAGQLYRIIGSGAVVALYGPLGSGKTTFVRGLARVAGVNPEEVNSPSFTLINEYPGGAIPLYHFDLYRVSGSSEVHAAGGDEYLLREGIVCIEWAEKGPSFLPADRYEVRMKIIDRTSREITITRKTP